METDEGKQADTCVFNLISVVNFEAINCFKYGDELILVTKNQVRTLNKTLLEVPY